MICKNCGKEIAEDSRFCNYCGVPQSSHPDCNASCCTNTQSADTMKRHLLTRKQAIFWGLYFVYTMGWVLSLCNQPSLSTEDIVKGVLFWILPLLFVVAKRSMKSFIK